MKKEQGNGKRLVVKSGVKAGHIEPNHNSKRLIVKSGVEAGGVG